MCASQIVSARTVNVGDSIAVGYNDWRKVASLDQIDVWTFEARFSDGSRESYDHEELLNVRRS